MIRFRPGRPLPGSTPSRLGLLIFLPAFASKQASDPRQWAICQLDHAAVSGYEIHAGRSKKLGPALRRPFTAPDGGAPDGVLSADGTDRRHLSLTVVPSHRTPSQATAELGGSCAGAANWITAFALRREGYPSGLPHSGGTTIWIPRCTAIVWSSACNELIPGWCAVGKTGWPSTCCGPSGLAVTYIATSQALERWEMSTR